ncbi:MAG: tryptophan--tRNA ligase [Elusimicrobia bacterium]|nr:tryptophan--tRNA ligase [Elusimicrobiota bacterium]MBD3412509.1 tryptophan--tRNA ligase [Elusimicrobiota bacterium]
MALKRVFSGIQPTGEVHIGNYLGALKNWVRLQDQYQSVYCIVDMHAMTIPDPAELKNSVLFTAAILLAIGIDSTKAMLFVQSDVAAHAELAWILTCHTYYGELRRMTQFKEKTGTSQEQSGAGLFVYPALMAADILLYDTHVVPVGEDQKQHLELTRTLARRFNNAYGKELIVPEAYIGKHGARVMALDNPKKKMSKSASSRHSYISLMDSDDEIARKIKRSVTDSGTDILYDPDTKPAVSNLLVIFSEFSGRPINELEKHYTGKGYRDFKNDLAEAAIDAIGPIRSKVTTLLKDDKRYILDTLTQGAEKASAIASAKINRIKEMLHMGTPDKV